MHSFRSMTDIPPLVKRALNLAEQMKRRCQCSLETGRLLRLLASQLQTGVICEVGSGCGVSSAWIVSDIQPGVSFFTIEADEAMAAAARALFDDILNVRVIRGDWRERLPAGRVSMLSASARGPGEQDPERLLQLLREGGMVLLDGLTPREHIPLDLRDQPDTARDFWLNDGRLVSTEVLVSQSESVILATRLE